jgi:hypothetical protein
MWETREARGRGNNPAVFIFMAAKERNCRFAQKNAPEQERFFAGTYRMYDTINIYRN